MMSQEEALAGLTTRDLNCLVIAIQRHYPESEGELIEKLIALHRARVEDEEKVPKHRQVGALEAAWTWDESHTILFMSSKVRCACGQLFTHQMEKTAVDLVGTKSWKERTLECSDVVAQRLRDHVDQHADMKIVI